MPNVTQIRQVAERLLDDQDVHENLSSAARNLREVQVRVRRKGVKAAEDKKTYDKAREAIVAVLTASRVVKPQPTPKRRARKLGFALALVAGAVLLLRRLRATDSTPSQEPGT